MTVCTVLHLKVRNMNDPEIYTLFSILLHLKVKKLNGAELYILVF